MGLGVGTNNFSELISLNNLLHFALAHSFNHLQIFSDSKIIINWFNKISAFHVHSIKNILDEILILKEQFNYIMLHVNIFTGNVTRLLANYPRRLRHIPKACG